jgi:signal transduction histidine kinase
VRRPGQIEAWRPDAQLRSMIARQLSESRLRRRGARRSPRRSLRTPRTRRRARCRRAVPGVDGEPSFLEEHVHPEDLAKIREVLATLRADTEVNDLRLEHRCVKADGTLIWAHTGVHREDERGHRLFRGVTVDINSIKAAEQREREARAVAERAVKARDEVLAVVSHDLRTPLKLKGSSSPDLVALAASLGYADRAHFTRDFTLTVGQVPRSFARKLRDVCP